MQSLREVYKIGKGPSSSHTMGPHRACRLFAEEQPEAESFVCALYDSLALTGAGHGTERAVREAFAPRPVEIRKVARPDFALPHPNTMDLTALKGDRAIASMRVMSVGGGDIEIEGRPALVPPDVYPERRFRDIAEFCRARNMRLSDYVFLREGAEIRPFLWEVWQAMRQCVQRGLSRRGVLPGGLGVERKAQYLFNQRHIDESPETRENRIVCAYAFAAGEENADGGTVVTAPTCGACAAVPAVLMYSSEKRALPEERVIRALAVAGLIGDLVKTNASVSGAECGCQAEIGTACSMAAAGLGEMLEMGVDQIEYAAEVAMEHHLGLTCDPVRGLVQIPCIERNAVAAMRAINAVRIANFLTSTRKISFDMVVETMYETGKDLSRRYRETSEGGLARLYSDERADKNK